MTAVRWRPGPPSGTVPVVMPGDVVLVNRPGLAVWAGAVAAYPEGFEFTLLMQFDVGRVATPVSLDLDAPFRDRETRIAVRFGDGLWAADLNLNKPPGQPQGAHVTLQYGGGPEGWDSSRYWVSPLPPPGPVELAIYLNGETNPAGTAHLDGAALVRAASSAEVVWSTAPQPGSW